MKIETFPCVTVPAKGMIGRPLALRTDMRRTIRIFDNPWSESNHTCSAASPDKRCRRRNPAKNIILTVAGLNTISHCIGLADLKSRGTKIDKAPACAEPEKGAVIVRRPGKGSIPNLLSPVRVESETSFAPNPGQMKIDIALRRAAP